MQRNITARQCRYDHAEQAGRLTSAFGGYGNWFGIFAHALGRFRATFSAAR